MSNNLDRLFKNALRNRTCEPPPRVWENIEASLKSRRRKLIPWWIRSAAAAALVAAAIWLLQLRERESQEIQWVKVLPPVVEPVVFPEPIVQPEINNEAQPMPHTGQPNPVVSPVLEIPAPVTAMRPAKIDSKIESSPVQLALQEPSSLRREIIPLVNGQALKNGEAYYALLKSEMPDRQTKAEEKEQKSDRNLKLALSGHVAPVYTSGTYRTTATNARGYRYSNSQMNGQMNVSGGVRLSIATDKKLSVQTGLFYSRMGQQTDEKMPRPQSMAFATDAARETGEYIVTPLGNLNSRTKGVAYRSEEAIMLSNNNNSRTSNIEQVFNTVEIPLALRYRFFDQKIRLSVAGGFSGNIIVDNRVYLIKGDEKEYIGSTEDIRRFNLSTDLGIGIEYPISQSIKIMLEPGFKYYLQSLSRNSQIDYKPYMFSLSTGIGIEF